MYPQNNDETNNVYLNNETQAEVYAGESNESADEVLTNIYNEKIVDESDAPVKDNILVCDGLVKIYKTDDVEVLALQGLELEIERGELVAIIGKSGSGKSTLLNMIGGLEKPTAGRLYVDGHDLFAMSEKGLVEYRRKSVGFVWQNSGQNLFPYFTALQNVEAPLYFDHMSQKARREKAMGLLKMIGIDHRANSYPAQMSGGEQQRVAIARAVAHKPKIIFADEPTGALDTNTGLGIIKLFKELIVKEGITIVMTTHDPNLMDFGDAVYEMEDGELKYVPAEQ